MAYTFDIRRDNDLIAKGTHFFCHGHLCAVPIEHRSHKPEFCRECLPVIRVARKLPVTNSVERED